MKILHKKIVLALLLCVLGIALYFFAAKIFVNNILLGNKHYVTIFNSFEIPKNFKLLNSQWDKNWAGHLTLTQRYKVQGSSNQIWEEVRQILAKNDYNIADEMYNYVCIKANDCIATNKYEIPSHIEIKILPLKGSSSDFEVDLELFDE